MIKIIKSLIAIFALIPGIALLVSLSSTLTTELLFEPRHIPVPIKLFAILFFTSAISTVIIWVDYIKNIFRKK